MALETFNYLDSLVPSNPSVTDGLVGGDDHIRGIKLALQNTFPNLTGAVTATQAQINAIAALLVNGVLRGNGAVPAGAISDFGGLTAPTGWIICDGQAISRTDNADLFAAIGTVWGAGDGSTTFNVPPLFNRYRRHRSSSFAGNVGTLQGPANFAHTHTGSGVTGFENQAHVHSFSGTTGNDFPDHSHAYTASANSGPVTGGGSFSLNASPSSASTGGASTRHAHNFSGTTSGEAQNHNHNFSLTTSGGSSDDANEARPYSATVLTCIKA